MKKSINVWPKITIVMTTFNDEKGVERALDSVKMQIYPKDKVEIIVIDNGSKDNSVKVAKKYTKNVFISLLNPYRNRADGMRKASGEFIYMILEQDMEFRGKYFLQKMIKPLVVNKKLTASFTREYPRKDQPPITRFISYHPIQCDPLFEYLSVPIEKTIIINNSQYKICEYKLDLIPPVTHMLFRKSFLMKTSVWKQEKDYDHDTVVKLVKAGYMLFAYVPFAGDYHHHAINIKQLVYKRIRNLNNHYFPLQNSIKYKWLDINSRTNLIKLIIWVIYANLLFPAAIRGFFRYLKYKDWVLLLEPLIAIIVTDTILLEFLKNQTGRKIVLKLLGVGK